jgi:hypothetical protein
MVPTLGGNEGFDPTIFLSWRPVLGSRDDGWLAGSTLDGMYLSWTTGVMEEWWRRLWEGKKHKKKKRTSHGTLLRAVGKKRREGAASRRMYIIVRLTYIAFERWPGVLATWGGDRGIKMLSIIS